MVPHSIKAYDRLEHDYNCVLEYAIDGVLNRINYKLRENEQSCKNINKCIMKIRNKKIGVEISLSSMKFLGKQIKQKWLNNDWENIINYIKKSCNEKK